LQKHNQQLQKFGSNLKNSTQQQNNLNEAISAHKSELSDSAQMQEEVFDLIKSSSKQAANNMIKNFSKMSGGSKQYTNSIKSDFKNLFRSIQSDLVKMDL